MGKLYNSEMNQNEHIRQMTGMRSPSRDDLVEVQIPGAFSSDTAGWPEWAVPWEYIQGPPARTTSLGPRTPTLAGQSHPTSGGLPHFTLRAREPKRQKIEL